MRTTLDIPEDLMDEARNLLGFKSKTDTVVLSLRELIRRRRIEELKSMLGKVKLEIDIPASRRRPHRSGRSVFSIHLSVRRWRSPH
ncbi:MAG: type II toxin-antitoxin system VapB family antitoxin [Acidobacteria bacterium]|nr:type II toxin-antitoxin system VapB family antitoxin [Acidobacteriota bacterium]